MARPPSRSRFATGRLSVGRPGPRGRLRRALAGVLAALAAGALVACNGGGEEATPEPTPTTAPPQLIAAASPQELQSYRYSVSLLLLPAALPETPSDWPADQQLRVAVQGEWTQPDRERSTSSVDLGIGAAIETESIRVGDQHWIRIGNGPWRESSRSDLESTAGLDFSPSVLFADDAAAYEMVAQRLSEHPWTEETVKGIATRRFTFTEAEFNEIFAGEEELLPIEVDAEISAEMWLSVEFGTPVSVILRGHSRAGEEILLLQLDLWDMNARDIAIEPPQ